MPKKKYKEQNLYTKLFIPELQNQLKEISGIDVRNCITENNYKHFWEMIKTCYPPVEIKDDFGKTIKIKKIPKKTTMVGAALTSLKLNTLKHL